MIRKLILWLPFVLIVALFGMFYLGLRKPDDHSVPSQVVGRPLPQFAAAAALPTQPGVSSADFGDGKPRLLNVFASWCVPCADEAPVLVRLKAQGVEINGVAIHDTSGDLQSFLAANGNPYSRIGLDADGGAEIAFGSSGVPETFVVDGKGKILLQHMGAVTDEDVPGLMALLGAAR